MGAWGGRWLSAAVTPRGLLLGAEMLSGHLRGMPRLRRRICRQRRSEPSVLQWPRQAGHGARVDGALVCRRTDGTLLPSSHRDLQRSSPSLAACLRLYEAGWRRAATAQGRHDWSSAVMSGRFHAGGIRIWGRETQVGSRGVAGENRAFCWGLLRPPCRHPISSIALDSLQGKIGPSLAV